jgi:ankyrin repeat protein
MNRYFLKNLLLGFALAGHPLFLQPNALHDAINNEDFDGVQRLVVEQPNLMDDVDDYGATPLRWAVRADNGPMVAFLLSHGAGVDAVDRCGNTALHCAADHLCLNSARVLLEHRASVCPKNKKGKAPLHLAASPLPSAPIENQAAMIQLLKKYRAKLNTQDAHGNTPLRYAIRGYNKTEFGERVPREATHVFFNDAAQELINLGARVNMRDKKKNTLLHAAAYIGNAEAVTMLLRVPGIHLSAVNCRMQTPRESALVNGNHDIAWLIRQAEEAATLRGSHANILGSTAEEEEYGDGEDDRELDYDWQTAYESPIEGGDSDIAQLISQEEEAAGLIDRHSKIVPLTAQAADDVAVVKEEDDCRMELLAQSVAEYCLS